MPRTKSTPRISTRVLTAALCVAVAGCAIKVENKENMLAAAGFMMIPANTPARQASLKRLPPHKFLHAMRGNVLEYGYADPTICDCFYYGDQAAYNRYRENVFQKKLADEARFNAEINEENFNEWGPG